MASAGSNPIRDDLLTEHAAALERIGSPGTWWTAADRVAIAREVRGAATCVLCAQRSKALAPTHVNGEHTRWSELAEPVVDLAHRVAVDPGRITKYDFGAWQDAISDGEYVELIGVVIQIIAIDTFARALDRPIPDMPEPAAGEPSRLRPAAAEVREAWVPTLPFRGRDEDSWALYKGKPTPHVARALSLVPQEVIALSRLSSVQYVHGGSVADITVNGDRALSRPQMELIAARVSALNECFY